MSDFSVVLKNRAGTAELYPPQGFRLTVQRYSSKAIGGPDLATIRVDGVGDALWSVCNWLGYGVEIRNPIGEPVWWGYIEEAVVSVGKRERGVSLSNVFNRVKVTCTIDDVDGVPARYDTTWAEDADSIARYGIREKRYNIGKSTEAVAVAVRDQLLKRFSTPIPRRGRGTQGDTMLTCRGWWDVFGQQYFGRSDGIEEFIESGDVEQMLNWGVTSSLVSFQGATTTYTRAVAGATNATPIVITTATNHALKSGNVVTISGVGGNTNANGTFKIASVTGNTFALTDQTTGANITGNGSYTAGGTVTRVLDNSTQTIIRYGKPISDASNATPIVISCTAHGYSNGNIVEIAGVNGNTSANGTFKVASATSNTFALTDPTTGVNIAGNGDYAVGGVLMSTTVEGPFAPLLEGESIVVSGSASNNGTFTIVRSSSQGHVLEVSSILTSEASGSSVTIKNYGQQVAQSFTPTSSWNAVEVAVRLTKHYTPTFNVVVELRSNNAGVPSATVLGSATIDRSTIGNTAQWEKISLASPVALVAGTTYWLVVRTTAGAAFYDDGFSVSLDTNMGHSTGVLKVLTPAATWVDRPVNADLPFRVLDAVDTATQVAAIFAQFGSLFAAIDVSVSSGITSNQFRSGENTALDEISKLLEAGNASGVRLIPSVTVSRVIKLASQPTATENEIHDRDGELFYSHGAPCVAGLLPVGQWVREHGLPQNLDFMAGSELQFVEEAEYDCEQGELTWLGQDDEASYSLPGVKQG